MASLKMSPTSACLSILVAMLLTNVCQTESATILIGGDKGWTFNFNYATWIATNNIQFRVGDTVVFVNKDAIEHTVAMLPNLDAYNKCNTTGLAAVPVPIGGNYTLVIPSSFGNATLYAACTVPGHCLLGQKIMDTVAAANAGSPTSSPTTPAKTPTSSPGPSPSSSDADVNRYICWTTAILLIAACFWGPSLSL